MSLRTFCSTSPADVRLTFGWTHARTRTAFNRISAIGVYNSFSGHFHARSCSTFGPFGIRFEATEDLHAAAVVAVVWFSRWRRQRQARHGYLGVAGELHAGIVEL